VSLASTIPWSDYQKLPPDKRSRPITDAEYAALTQPQRIAGGLDEATEGAPANFNGPVFPNPDHIRPQLDTEPAIAPTRLPQGVTFQKGNYSSGAKFDASNPLPAEVIPAMGREIGAKMSGTANTDTATAAPMPWEKYATSAPAGPWQKYGTTTPAAQATGAKPTTEAAPEPSFLNTLGREVSAAGQTLNPIAIGKGVYHAFSDDPTAEEQKEFSTDKNPGVIKRGAIGVTRMTADPIANAAIWYGRAAQGKIPNATDQALSVLPEAIGTGAGNVVGGKVIESAPGAIARAGQAIAENPKAIATAPIRLAARTAESVANQKLVPLRKIANLNTPADAAESLNVKMPGRDFGLKIQPKIAPAAAELDATGENKPFAGGMDEFAPKPGKILDATGENKPFAGGLDEFTPKKIAATKAATPAPSIIPSAAPAAVEAASAPAVLSAKIPAATSAPAMEAAPAIIPSATSDPILAKLRGYAAKIKAEEAKPAIAGEDEDLTGILQRSLDQVKARKGGPVNTTAAPTDLLKRWGVDESSFAEGRSQTRGMKPGESEAEIQKLTERYKQGKPVDPVIETRDADNNLVEVDGRGRALAAHRAGVERIPVIVRRLPASSVQ
jgi:hypothetical protein